MEWLQTVEKTKEVNKVRENLLKYKSSFSTYMDLYMNFKIQPKWNDLPEITGTGNVIVTYVSGDSPVMYAKSEVDEPIITKTYTPTIPDGFFGLNSTLELLPDTSVFAISGHRNWGAICADEIDPMPEVATFFDRVKCVHVYEDGHIETCYWYKPKN